MQKKNVLHLVEYLYLGGIERLLEQLAHKMGEKTNISFFTYETPILQGIGKQIAERGFPVFTYKKSKGRDWLLFLELVRVVKTHHIDVIHTHDFGPMEYAVLLKMRFPHLRLIHTQHTVFEFIQKPKYKIFFQVASFFYFRISVVSHFVRETLLHHCPLMKRSILLVTPNGVDLDHFKRNTLTVPKTLSTTAPPQRLRLVSVSRISSEKNLMYLLNSLRLLKKMKVPFIFHHAGSALDSKQFDFLKDYIRQHSLDEDIVFHGFSPDVSKILALGDIFLSASFTEGHPVSVLEAMALEKMCYCSDIPAHRELGATISFFDLGDEAHLADLLVSHFHGMPESLIAEVGKASREKVEKCFSLESMVNNYVNQYQ